MSRAQFGDRITYGVCVYATFGIEMVDWKTLQIVLRLSLVIYCCDK